MNQRPVLFLNPVSTLGGAERALLDLIAMLRQTRVNMPLHLITGADGPLCEEAQRLGASVGIVPMPPNVASLGDSGLRSSVGWKPARAGGFMARTAIAGMAISGYVRRLRQAVARARPRLVHSNGLKCHVLTGKVVPRSVPVIWHIHDFIGVRPILGRTLRWVAAAPTRAIANSESTAADFRQVLPGVPTEAIYNGIDTDRFAPGAAYPVELDRLAGLPPAAPGTIRVGLVSTYARWKGQIIFLNAAAKLKGKPGPPIRSYVIGGPVYRTTGSQFSRAELQHEIATRNLGSCLGLIPFQRDLPGIYRSLDIVVHASTKPEPFGLTIVEAMACGRAVVVAKAGGAAELFTEGQDAIGILPADPAALAGAIHALALDSERRADLGAKARETALGRFSRARMVERVLEAYSSSIPKIGKLHRSIISPLV